VIDSDALLLHHLPEVDMRIGEILAVEALIRWQHPTLGLLLPDSFMGIAESINLAGELGRSVIRTACAEFSRWRSHGLGRNVMLRPRRHLQKHASVPQPTVAQLGPGTSPAQFDRRLGSAPTCS
jgi:EAL domain-containing protein (putative c-di-GMP-specific phosphodiesterase class I)